MTPGFTPMPDLNVKGARGDLARFLDQDLGAELRAAGLRKVYGCDPKSWDVPAGASVTTERVTADNVVLLVRVWALLAGTTVEAAADIVDDAVSVIDGRLPSAYGEQEWEYGYSDVPDAWVATLTVSVGREDQ